MSNYIFIYLIIVTTTATIFNAFIEKLIYSNIYYK